MSDKTQKDEQPEARTENQSPEKAVAQEQASLALVNLVSRGVPLKEARKRLGIK